MLMLIGILRSLATLGGGQNKKTGEIIPLRPVLQVETLDGRGLVQIQTITVPDLAPWAGKLNEQISLPVRAWAIGTPVNFQYESGDK